MTLEYERLDQITGRTLKAEFPPFCTACGYNMTGVASGRCPECGQIFVRGEWEKALHELRRLSREAAEANGWVRYGLGCGVAGLALAAARIPLRGLCLGQVLGGLGIALSLGAVFLGLGVFRITRAPSWAREYFPSPRFDAGGACIALGALAAAATIAFW